VVHAQFSHDGTYLAVADLSGDITANKEIVWEFETSDISVKFYRHFLLRLDMAEEANLFQYPIKLHTVCEH
jgi:hypothetical protein